MLTSIFSLLGLQKTNSSSCYGAVQLASSCNINIKSMITNSCGSSFATLFTNHFSRIHNENTYYLKNNCYSNLTYNSLFDCGLSSSYDNHCDTNTANNVISNFSLKITELVNLHWNDETKLRCELKKAAPSEVLCDLIDKYYCNIKSSASINWNCQSVSIAMGLFSKSCISSLIVCGSIDVDWYKDNCCTKKIWCDGSLDIIISKLKNKFDEAKCVRSPLVLDLDGDGVETININKGIYFDHDNNGFAEKTGWAGKDDGFLVIDKNNNGKIDNGTEMFGNNNSSGISNGFQALFDYDTNHDGKINYYDADFSKLKIWRDSNSNGITDSGELFTLHQAGIRSISTGYTEIDQQDTQGNYHQQAGSFTRWNGTKGSVEDVWFQVDESKTQDLHAVALSNEIKSLPELAGFGNVHSLRQAIAQSNSSQLKTIIQQFSAEQDASVRQNLMDKILYLWTGVYNLDPNAYVDNNQLNYIGDARRIAVLEKFLGEDFIGSACTGEISKNPNIPASLMLKNAYNQLSEYFYAHLNLQVTQNCYVSYVQDAYCNKGYSVSSIISYLKNKISSDFAINKTDARNKLFDLGATLFNTGETGKTILNELQKWQPNNKELASYISNIEYKPLFGTDANDILKVAMSSQSVLFGGKGDDILAGSEGNDIIYGGVGNDTIYGNDGKDALFGGEGNDTYYVSLTDQADTITDSQGSDTVIISNVSNESNLWFSRNNNDLVINMIGCQDDSITINNWYSSTSSHIEQFKIQSTGKVLLDTQVNNLVDAMASMTPPAGGQTTLSAEYKAALTPVLAANWH